MGVYLDEEGGVGVGLGEHRRGVGSRVGERGGWVVVVGQRVLVHGVPWNNND